MSQLIGRESELDEITSTIASLRAGHGAVMVIEGAPGMGKTRLLDLALEMAVEARVRTGRGAGREQDRLVTMAPLLEALCAPVDPLVDPARLERSLERFWLLQELANELELAALADPLLICLDDLQWADGGTLAALRMLPRRLSTVPIGWLVTLRSGETSRNLAETVQHLRRLGATSTRLGALDGAAVGALVAERLGAWPDDGLARFLEAADGSPFMVAELIAGLLEEDLVEIADGRASLREARVPMRFRDIVGRRLERLSDTARRAISVGSVLGMRFSLELLAATLSVEVSELLSPVDELIASGGLRQDGEAVSFRHDLVREAVLETLPAASRLALRRRAADVLMVSGAPAVEVALHLAASARPGDTRAIGTLHEAALAVSATDPDAAANLCQRAFALTLSGDPLRARLAADTTIFLHAAGRVAEGQAFATRVLGEILPYEDEALVCLSLSELLALTPDVRARMNRRALALEGVSQPLRTRHLCALAYTLVGSGRFDEARRARAEALRAAEQGADVTSHFTLQLGEAALLYLDAQFSDAIVVLERAMRDRHRAGDQTRGRITTQWRAEALMALDRATEALEVVDAERRAAEREHQTWAAWWYEATQGRQLFQVGRLGDAAAVLEGVLERESPEAGLSIVGLAALVALGRTAIHTGDARLSERCAALARSVAASATEPSVGRHTGWLLALQALAAGSAAEARAALAGPDAETSLPNYPMDVTDPPHVVRIALAADDRALAHSAAALAVGRARRVPGVASIAGAALHCRGLIEDDAGLLDDAVAALRAGARPLALASALEDSGRAQAVIEAAAERLTEALDRYAEAGAVWDAARVHKRLRALGVRRQVPRALRPQEGWDALTPSELKVARLVARGLTNRQVAERLFLSPHTVGMHVRHAFRKLGIGSRVELARLVVEHDERLPS